MARNPYSVSFLKIPGLQGEFTVDVFGGTVAVIREIDLYLGDAGSTGTDFRLIDGNFHNTMYYVSYAPFQTKAFTHFECRIVCPATVELGQSFTARVTGSPMDVTICGYTLKLGAI